MKPETGGLDRMAVASAYDRRLAPDERADFLLRETEARMLDKLGFIRLDPVARILDVGCGLGSSLAPLAARFPQARWIGIDLSLASLCAAARRLDPAPSAAWRRWFAGLARSRASPLATPFWVCADAHGLPIADRSIDLVWSNLAAHWFDDPVSAIAQWRRVLRPGGLLLFSLFGVDTLRELPLTGRRYPDLHDWGDALVAAGFADPVMDVERLQLQYQGDAALLRDAAAIRAGIGLPEPVGARADNGRTLTVELVFGHAWRPLQEPRDDGLQPIRLIRREQPGAQ